MGLLRHSLEPEPFSFCGVHGGRGAWGRGQATSRMGCDGLLLPGFQDRSEIVGLPPDLAPKKLSTIRYDFGKAVPWDGHTGKSQGERTRCSDLYVFCLYPEKEKQKANVLDVPACDFYAVSTTTLNKEFGEARSLSLAAVRRMAMLCKFDELRATVDRIVDGIQEGEKSASESATTVLGKRPSNRCHAMRSLP
jgi:hypothetical protein